MIGTLVSIGGLAASSELTAIRATGMPMLRLLSTILMPAFVATILLFIGGEVFAPSLEQRANYYRADIRQQNLQLQLGTWYQSEHRLIHMGDFVNINEVRNLVLVELTDDNRIERVIQASSSTLHDDTWSLQDGQVVDWAEGEANKPFVGRQPFAELSQEPPLSTEIITNLAQPLSVLTLPALWTRVNFQNTHSVIDPVVSLRLWERLSAPLLTMTLSFIGIAFVFGSIRSISMGTRIFMGIALGLVLQITQQFFGPIGLFMGMTPALAATLPVFMAFALGVYLFRRNT